MRIAAGLCLIGTVLTALILLSGPNRRSQIPSREAFEAFSRGKWFLEENAPGHLERSAAAFEQAVAADPDYAPSFAGLATAYVEMEATAQRWPSEVMPKARAAALRALAINSSLSEAHLALGRVEVNYDRNGKAGCLEIERALRLDPADAHAHMIHAMLCLVPNGRIEEAKAEIQTAQRLDPVKHVTSGMEISLALIERRYDEALKLCRRVVEISPTSWNIYPAMASIYIRKGMLAEARQMIDRANQLPPRNSKAESVMAQIYASMGEREKALELLRKLESTSRQRYVPATDIAVVYASLSDVDSAVAWLEKACQERSGTVTGIKTNPAYDKIRHDARFISLLRTIDSQ